MGQKRLTTIQWWDLLKLITPPRKLVVNEKNCLAYSGGLDTSIILKWLQINYDAEIIAYTSNIGQNLDKKKIIQNAKRLGVKKIIIEDLQNTFVKD